MRPHPLLLMPLTVLLGACNGPPAAAPTTLSSTPPRPARINHLAFFKLEDPDGADELVADCDRLLATIPGVVSYYAGKHLDVGRDTVDGDYDVGFYVGFMTEDDYAGYVEHPNHVEVVTKWRPRLEWLRVHDVVDETE